MVKLLREEEAWPDKVERNLFCNGYENVYYV
jgi:hypothetical protein